MREMELLGMDGVSIWVGDLGRAAAFYGLVLGLEECERAPDAVAFEVGLETLTLRDWPAAHATDLPTPAAGCVPVLQVDDLEALARRLATAGVEVEAGTDEAGAQGLAFRDPDGNTLRVVSLPGAGAEEMLARAEATGESAA